jgi:hypothetical protein
VRRSTVPTSAPLSEAATLLVLTSWTGSPAFSGLRLRISSYGHRRPVTKKEAEVNLAHNRYVRSPAVHLANEGRYPGEPRTPRGRRRSAIPDHRKIATLKTLRCSSCAPELQAARFSLIK